MPVIQLEVPTLVVLVGVSASGKSTFAAEHFAPTEVVSSDRCRELVCDDAEDQAATRAAFEVLHLVVAKRLELGRLTVVDATNVQVDARRALLRLAADAGVPAVAVVLDVALEECVARDAARQHRTIPPRVLRDQHRQLRRSVDGLATEGFVAVHHLAGVAGVAAARFRRRSASDSTADRPL